jgi:hypothetical protein
MIIVLVGYSGGKSIINVCVVVPGLSSIAKIKNYYAKSAGMIPDIQKRVEDREESGQDVPSLILFFYQAALLMSKEHLSSTIFKACSRLPAVSRSLASLSSPITFLIQLLKSCLISFE